jgi:hypothetical protein
LGCTAHILKLLHQPSSGILISHLKSPNYLCFQLFFSLQGCCLNRESINLHFSLKHLSCQQKLHTCEDQQLALCSQLVWREQRKAIPLHVNNETITPLTVSFEKTQYQFIRTLRKPVSGTFFTQ